MATADVSARPAVPGDHHAITDIQLAAWSTLLGAEAVAALPREEILASWEAAIVAPPSREHRVLVATDGPLVVGFAALAPGGDVVALEVAPQHRRAGHGSRLLAAAADTIRLQGGTDLRGWAIDGDDAREQFLRGAGLADGGVRRGIDGPDGEITERLWRAELEER